MYNVFYWWQADTVKNVCRFVCVWISGGAAMQLYVYVSSNGIFEGRQNHSGDRCLETSMWECYEFGDDQCYFCGLSSSFSFYHSLYLDTSAYHLSFRTNILTHWARKKLKATRQHDSPICERIKSILSYLKPIEFLMIEKWTVNWNGMSMALSPLGIIFWQFEQMR